MNPNLCNNAEDGRQSLGKKEKARQDKERGASSSVWDFVQNDSTRTGERVLWAPIRSDLSSFDTPTQLLEQFRVRILPI